MTQPETTMRPGAPADRESPHISKTALSWMACLFGVFGAHWWYLGRRRAWMVTAFSVLMIVIAQFYPVWWENPAFLLLVVPLADGFIEALVFALKPDAEFDRKYNPDSARATRTGWGSVLAAISATFLGGVTVIFWIAMIVVYVYTEMGWLDDYVF